MSTQNQEDRELVKAAIGVSKHSYSPYSNFAVGAAIRGSNGKIYAGCNVENAAYPVITCAEAGAIAAMVADGECQITAIAVAGPGEQLVTPCGACRQRIREFAAADVPIFIAGMDGQRATFTLDALLPFSFGPENLE